MVGLFNKVLATELVCILPNKRYYYSMSPDLNAKGADDEFRVHAIEEQQHADVIAQRIVQLGGEPNLSPEGILNRSHSDPPRGGCLRRFWSRKRSTARIWPVSSRKGFGDPFHLALPSTDTAGEMP